MEPNPVVLANEYLAQQAKTEHDYEKAIHYSSAAREAALGVNDKLGFLRSSFNIAHYQYALGRMADCISTIEALLEDDSISGDSELTAKARILLAHALQESGASERAVIAVEEATNVIQDQPGPLRLKAQHSVVSTLAEKGEVEQAWREALVLDGLVGPESAEKIKGMAYWTIGNAAFMSGRVDEGKDYHLRAMTALASVGDVNIWASFNKAAANMRIEAGVIDEETAEYLERAEVAISVADGSTPEKLEILLSRAHWDYASGNAREAERILREVADRAGESFPYIHVQACQLLASCLLTLDRPNDAMKFALETERMLLESGATERLAKIRTVIEQINAVRL